MFFCRNTRQNTTPSMAAFSACAASDHGELSIWGTALAVSLFVLWPLSASPVRLRRMIFALPDSVKDTERIGGAKPSYLAQG